MKDILILHVLLEYLQRENRNPLFSCKVCKCSYEDQGLKQIQLYPMYPVFQNEWNICDQHFPQTNKLKNLTSFISVLFVITAVHTFLDTEFYSFDDTFVGWSYFNIGI